MKRTLASFLVAALAIGPAYQAVKKVSISVDMEGISGVSGSDQTSAGQSEYGRSRKLMAQDANAALKFNPAHFPVRGVVSPGGERTLWTRK